MKQVEKLFGIARLISKAVTANQNTLDFMSDIKASGFTVNEETLSFLHNFMEEKRQDFFYDYIKFKLGTGATYTSLQYSSKIYDSIHGFTSEFTTALSTQAQQYQASNIKLNQNLELINKLNYSGNVPELYSVAHSVINDLYERSGDKRLDDITLDKLSDFKNKITDALTKEPAILVYSYIKEHVFKLINQFNLAKELNSNFSNSSYASSDELIDKLVSYGTLYNTESEQFLTTKNNFIYTLINTVYNLSNILFNSAQEDLSSEQFVDKLVAANLLIKDSSAFEADKAEYLEQFELCKSQNLSSKQILENQASLIKGSLRNFEFSTIETLYNSAVAQNVKTLQEVLESFAPKKDLLFSADQELTQKLQNPNTDESLSYCKYFYTTLLTEPQMPIGICHDLVIERNGIIFLKIKSPYKVLIDNNQNLLKQNLVEQDTLIKLDTNLSEAVRNLDLSDEQLLDKTVEAYSNLLKHLYLYTESNEALMANAVRESYPSCDSTQQRIKNLNQLETPEHWHSKSCYQCDIDKLHQTPAEQVSDSDWL